MPSRDSDRGTDKGRDTDRYRDMGRYRDRGRARDRGKGFGTVGALNTYTATGVGFFVIRELKGAPSVWIAS